MMNIENEITKIQHLAHFALSSMLIVMNQDSDSPLKIKKFLDSKNIAMLGGALDGLYSLATDYIDNLDEKEKILKKDKESRTKIKEHIEWHEKNKK